MAKERLVLADAQTVGGVGRAADGVREIPILGHFRHGDLGSLTTDHNSDIAGAASVEITGLVDGAIYELRHVLGAADGPLYIRPEDGLTAADATDAGWGIHVGDTSPYPLKLQEGQSGLSILNGGTVQVTVSIRRLV